MKVKEVEIAKEVMAGDVSPVAMFAKCTRLACLLSFASLFLIVLCTGGTHRMNKVHLSGKYIELN